MLDTENYMSKDISQNELLDMIAGIAAAYVSNHQVPQDELPHLMRTIREALLSTNRTKPRQSLGEALPFVDPSESIHDDYIVCLEDGKQLKMLKRHLKTAYGLSPEEYRERWGLSPDYPMVAPNYARQRSDLALQIGLGHSRKKKKTAMAA
jgi:predicted transcriptional regulator